MKKLYLAYIRVSTVKQGERGSSLIEQKSAIETYAARNNLYIAAWFEEMETAAKQGRREFAKLLSTLKRGNADGLIIHKIDRSARNLRDWAELGDLIDRGVDVRFVTDNFDLFSRGGRLSADIQAVVAADYIRNLRDEVKKGLYGRLKQGIYPFAAPIGYLNTGKGNLKRIDPLKGPLVQRLFERYGTNTVSLEELRHEFAKLGFKTCDGKPLAINTLSNILNNPFYAGVIRIRKTGDTYPGAHAPLISQELFERVRRILRGKTVPKAKKHRFLFRQLIRCGNCGCRRLTGEHHKGYVYYRCHSGCCPGVSWRGDVLEQAFLDQLNCIRFSGPDMTELAGMIQEELRGRGDEETKIKTALTLQLQNLDGRSARLTNLLIDGTIDQTIYKERKELLLLERQGVLERFQHAGQSSALGDLFAKFERKNSEILRYKSLLDDEKRELVETVCSNFSVQAENIAIALRSPYEEIAELANSPQCAHHRDDVRTFESERTKHALAALIAMTEMEPANENLPCIKSRPHVPTSPHAGFRSGMGDLP